MDKPYMKEIIEIMRKQVPYGFVKTSEAADVQKIIEEYLNERLSVEREIAYNKGFIDGAKSIRNVN